MKPNKPTSLFENCLQKLLEPVSAEVGQRKPFYKGKDSKSNSNVAHTSALAEVLYNLARHKILGVGCKKDFNYAHRLVVKVLKLETSQTALRALALSLCAMNLVDGRGVPADPDRALSLLVEAASFDPSQAAFNLGLFFDGRFGPVGPNTIDHDLAAFFYARSSRTGCLAARTNLALLHIQQKMSNFNTDLGWALLHESAKQGDKIASAAIKQLNG